MTHRSVASHVKSDLGITAQDKTTSVYQQSSTHAARSAFNKYNRSDTRSILSYRAVD